MKLKKNQILPAEVHPKLMPIFTESNPFKCIYGGRGGVKTHTGADWILDRSFMDDAYKKRSFGVRQFMNSIKDSSYSVIVKKIEQRNMEYYFDITKTEIRNKWTKHLIQFKGLDRNIDSIKSADDVWSIWGDEAHSIILEAFMKLNPTIYRVKGSEMLITFNPDHPDDPVSQMFIVPDSLRNGLCPYDYRTKGIVIKINQDENPYLSRNPQSKYYAPQWFEEMDMIYENDPEFARHVYEGEFNLTSDRLIYKPQHWTVVDPDKFEPYIPKNAKIIFGGDWGHNPDPSVALKMRHWREWDETKQAHVKYLYIEHEEVERDLGEDELIAMWDRIPGSREYPIITDNTYKALINRMQKIGFNIKASEKGAGSVKEGIAFVKGFKIIISKNCPIFQSEIKKYANKVDKKTGKVLSEVVKEDDHTMDSMRYGLEDDRMEDAEMNTGLEALIGGQQGAII